MGTEQILPPMSNPITALRLTLTFLHLIILHDIADNETLQVVKKLCPIKKNTPVIHKQKANCKDN